MHQPVIHIDFQRRHKVTATDGQTHRTLGEQVRLIQSANLTEHMSRVSDSVHRTQAANVEMAEASTHLRKQTSDLISGLRQLEDVCDRYLVELRRQIRGR